MRSFRSLLLAAACVTSQLGASGAALAQPSTVNVTAAEALFEQGRVALAAGDLDIACARFRESNRLDPAVGTLLNLADCEEKRGRLATAWMLFRRAVTELEANDDRLTIVRQRLSDLEGRVPKLVLELAPGEPTTTRANVAGVDFGSGSFGVPLPLDPGDYEIMVSAPGRSERLFPMTLVEGQTTRLEIAANPPGVKSDRSRGGEPGQESDETTAGEPFASRRTWAYVIGGAGAVGLGVGAVTGLLTLRQKDIADANCNDERRVCSEKGQQANETGRTLGAISTISFVFGLAGVGAATYLLLTEPEESDAAALSASIGVNSAALSFQKRF